MNFLVVGAGAMGCLFSARLKGAGYEVALLEKVPERARRINEQGIRVEGISGEYTAHVQAFIEVPSFSPDVVLICVKSTDTRKAAEGVRACVGPESRILTLQNGLGNVEILEEIFGKDRVLGGVTAEGATVLAPGHIRHAGRGETLIGPRSGEGNPVEEIVSAFNRAGFKSRSIENVQDLIWGKLIINVGINALTALTGLKNGRLVKFEGTLAIMEKAVEEADAVARAKGIHLPYPDPLARVKEVCEATAENVASMLQDILNKKTTEIDFINGAIVREGEALGIPTPVNFTLTALVRTIQKSYDERIF
ncbi:MAG: 2-dehydropantoate 2-reductase [Deltaproteobacteria bacterium]|nr:2-dehydropantoate 2-reductase [Deltaproteobacteria bacterium]MBW2016309.1 2-dehydropantoate 2-reductase [Deltaproteobacteria bacterium]MBW2128893.1 2-dehydropantoate 2-reductase [Deltaproteobacteria bacterium]MBW2303854.1 2-dehydropantoate 2-reductase [Deltaproteobacteria bacterium]